MRKTILLLLLISVYSYCGIGVGKSTTGTLPVEIIAFSAVQNNNCIQLSWTAATEVNNLGFDVERSILLNPTLIKGDAASAEGDWIKLGFIEGNGNSNSPKQYSFTDENITNGNYYYRLKQIDTDGSYSYSQIIEVCFGEIPKDYVLNQNYPNPFNPITVISYSIPIASFVTINVYDVLGNNISVLVNEKHEAGTHQVYFNASELTSGIYIYRIQAGNFTDVKKMVILK